MSLTRLKYKISKKKPLKFSNAPFA